MTTLRYLVINLSKCVLLDHILCEWRLVRHYFEWVWVNWVIGIGWGIILGERRVSGGWWDIILGGWRWAGMSGGGWGWVWVGALFDNALHVYKNIIWSDVRHGDSLSVEINKESKKVGPYSCAIKGFVDQPPQHKTIRHMPWETFKSAIFLLKEKNGRTERSVHSTKYRQTPIPAIVDF